MITWCPEGGLLAAEAVRRRRLGAAAATAPAAPVALSAPVRLVLAEAVR